MPVRVCRLWLLALAFGLVGLPAAAEPPARTAEQIQSDWLRQALVRDLPSYQLVRTGITAAVDAAGGVDGIKDGRYGFHTNSDRQPWWQVDLGSVRPIDEVRIYNRTDRGSATRAARLIVLVSDDGQRWTEIYRHNGTVFLGQPDGKPLTVMARKAARYVRVQLPASGYLHLDEVEVFGPAGDGRANLALHRRATQSSVSPWSTTKKDPTIPKADSRGDFSRLRSADLRKATTLAIARGKRLAAELGERKTDIQRERAVLDGAAKHAEDLPETASGDRCRAAYLEVRRAVRALAFRNPLLDFDDLLFVKRAPGSFTHMSDQYYGWFSRPGGGLYVLAGFKSQSPQLRLLTGMLPPGSVLRPDLSADGRRVLFAYCRHYPPLAEEPDKLNKANVPEDAFYHLYEIGIDGSGLRRLTRGKYDDFDGRYLPDGRIVFLSTRRGRFVQCTDATTAQRQDGSGGDCYVRCGGGPGRPVAVYTLHAMEADGRQIVPLSPFEMFEWTPSIDHQGRILYSRWDYVDRHNMPFMKLWATLPDGTNPQAIFGNFTRNPHCVFEARAIPGSHKLIFTASAHHALTGGPLVRLDPRKGFDGQEPLERLTPEVCYPETDGWPQTYFNSPYPLSEDHFLVAWSDQPLPPGVPPPGWGLPGPVNDLGLYLFDAFGNLELIYRDEAIGSETPLPIKPRRRATQVAQLPRHRPAEGEMVLADVYRGLPNIAPGTIRRLRLVGVPPKTHPTMNAPNLGATRDDPGKFVLGTVPVEVDGSARFAVPAGLTLFFQALDERGMAVQTMRSGVYVQPGQTSSCIGCHEHRAMAPPPVTPLALRRAASRITPGPEGSWPLDYRALVQPVLEQKCVSCHHGGPNADKPDLCAEKSYEALMAYGRPSLADHVRQRYAEGRSIPGAGAGQTSALVRLLDKGHYEVKLDADQWSRLLTWIDTYGQRLGSFDAEQEEELRRLKLAMAPLLAP